MQTMEAQLQQANLGVTASPAVANASPAVAGAAHSLQPENGAVAGIESCARC